MIQRFPLFHFAYRNIFELTCRIPILPHKLKPAVERRHVENRNPVLRIPQHLHVLVRIYLCLLTGRAFGQGLEYDFRPVSTRAGAAD